MMNIKTLTRYLLLAIIVQGSLTACTKEDLSVCFSKGVFRFNYAYPRLESDTEFPAPIKVVRMFIFDNTTGLFVTEFEKTVPEASTSDSFELSVELAPGDYHVVAWAGESHPQINTATTHGDAATPLTFIPGETTLEQAAMMLDNETLTRLNTPFITSKKPINLYHGTLSSAVFETGQEYSYAITLLRASHEVEVNIQDFRKEDYDVNSLELSASLRNHLLAFTPSMVHQLAQDVRYLPTRTEQIESLHSRSTLSVLRMEPKMLGDLVVIDSRDQREMFRRNLVSEIIALHPEVSPDPERNLSKYSKYTITLEIFDKFVGIIISIGDWHVRLVDVEI